MALPVTVLGGYLGAGKTTLVNHLLRHAAGRRIGVLVNEFGSLPVDADLIEGAEGNLLTLSGGCICCSYGDDLVAALADFAGRAGSLDQVLIEASGVALPGGIARSLGLLPGLTLDAVVVLVDGEQLRRQAADRYIGDTIGRQLADADLLVLNKADLLAPGEQAALLDWLAERTPVPVLVARQAELSPDLVLGLALDSHRFQATGKEHDTGTLDGAWFRLPDDIDVAALGVRLADPALGLVRAKGFARDRDGGWRTIQVVGRRADTTPAPAGESGPGRLVCIAHGRRIARLLLAGRLVLG